MCEQCEIPFSHTANKQMSPSTLEALDSDKLSSIENVYPVKGRSDIVWRNVFIFILLHIGAVYGFYLMFTATKWQTLFWVFYLYINTGLGITAGAHRLWSHRSYKASFPLRVWLMILNSAALQNHVIEWARDHRCHHKWSETDADPHDARRGFFFSHIGWLMVRKHPEVIRRGKTLDMNDLQADSVLAFQKRFYLPLALVCCFVIPAVIPLLWGEDLMVAYFVASVFRYVFTLHCTWTVNSLAHMYGYRPYDTSINPRENFSPKLQSIVTTLGEGFHNYHHTFPQDYRASEFGPLMCNFTSFCIDSWTLLGLASDRKTVSQDVIERRVQKSGSLKEHGWDKVLFQQ